MRDLEELLVAAIAKYREVLAAYAALEAPLDQGDGKALVERVQTLELRQAEAREIDGALLGRVEMSGSSPGSLPLLKEYRGLLAQAAECNKSLLDKARVHRAMVAAELAELKGNKVALAGYRIPGEQRGQVLSSNY